MKLDKESELKKKLKRLKVPIIIIGLLVVGICVAAFAFDVPEQLKGAVSNKEGASDILQAVWQVGWIKTVAGALVVFGIIWFVAQEQQKK